MKKVNEIDVIISLKDIIRALDKKLGFDSVNNIIDYASSSHMICNSYNNIDALKAKSILCDKVVKVKFYYAKHLLEPSYVPASTIELWNLIEIILFNNKPLSDNISVYDSIEEAKIQEMLNGTNALFEMTSKAVNQLKFCRQDCKWDPVLLWCPMTFGQVKAFLKRV